MIVFEGIFEENGLFLSIGYYCPLAKILVIDDYDNLF